MTSRFNYGQRGKHQTPIHEDDEIVCTNKGCFPDLIDLNDGHWAQSLLWRRKENEDDELMTENHPDKCFTSSWT